VLEHLYNPWQAMERLKPFLAPDVQVIVSVPSARNLGLMGKLAQGEWRYEASGLLDITHVRFFTYKEIRRFFYQLGYFVSKVLYGMDPALQALYSKYEHTCPADIDTGRLTIKNVGPDELMELCSMQMFVAAQPLPEGDSIIRNEFGDPVAPNAYEIWQKDRALKSSDLALYSQRMAQWQGRPRIHLALVVSRPDQQKIADTMWSLSAQHYAEIFVSVIADFALPQDVERGERLDWVQVSGGLLETVNRVLSQKPADWVGVIDAGDKVAPHGLLFFAEAMHVHPEWSLIYSDEDQLDSEGQRSLPHFKPDFNLDLLRSYPYIGGLMLLRQSLFVELGGFAPALLGAEEHDLALKACEKLGKKGVGHIPDVLYHRLQGGGHCSLPIATLVERGRQSVTGHLGRAGIDATVDNGLFPGSYRVRYALPGTPLVSILIRMQDQMAELQRALESIMKLTRYAHYEILIGDDGSASPDALAFLHGLEAMQEGKLKVLRLPGCGSLPAAHNRMAAESRGEFLVFWQIGCAAVQADWLECLLAHAARPEIGLAGPRLLQADGTVVQSGAILGLATQPAGAAFSGKPLDYPGYHGRAHLEQNYSALNGGCLMVRKSVFEELGGFDAAGFAQAHAEADFCLRLGAKAYSIVWTPFVNVMGNKPQEPLPDAEDSWKALFYERWLPSLARDPAYNINLCLRDEGFVIETLQPLTWDPLPWRPLPRILVNPADTMGCGEYRIF
ncbi:MAG: glycosyltransferase, partial [Sulfuricellaceae bacterium]|nr:glycosyltransferase [Sulfuricellaceae bacterium]